MRLQPTDFHPNVCQGQNRYYVNLMTSACTVFLTPEALDVVSVLCIFTFLDLGSTTKQPRSRDKR